MPGGLLGPIHNPEDYVNKANPSDVSLQEGNYGAMASLVWHDSPSASLARGHTEGNLRMHALRPGVKASMLSQEDWKDDLFRTAPWVLSARYLDRITGSRLDLDNKLTSQAQKIRDGNFDLNDPMAQAMFRQEEIMPLEEVNAMAAKYGRTKFDQPQLRGVMQFREANWVREDYNTQLVDQSESGFINTPLRFGTAFLTAAADPINLASALIPVVRESRWATLMGRTGLKAARRGLIVRGSRGAFEGTLGALAVEPIVLNQAEMEHGRYNADTFLMNVALGGGLGSLLRIGGGAFSDMGVRSRNLKRQPGRMVKAEAVARRDAYLEGAAVHADMRQAHERSVASNLDNVTGVKRTSVVEGEVLHGSTEYHTNGLTRTDRADMMNAGLADFHSGRLIESPEEVAVSIAGWNPPTLRNRASGFVMGYYPHIKVTKGADGVFTARTDSAAAVRLGELQSSLRTGKKVRSETLQEIESLQRPTREAALEERSGLFERRREADELPYKKNEKQAVRLLERAEAGLAKVDNLGFDSTAEAVAAIREFMEDIPKSQRKKQWVSNWDAGELHKGDIAAINKLVSEGEIGELMGIGELYDGVVTSHPKSTEFDARIDELDDILYGTEELRAAKSELYDLQKQEAVPFKDLDDLTFASPAEKARLDHLESLELPDEFELIIKGKDYRIIAPGHKLVASVSLDHGAVGTPGGALNGIGEAIGVTYVEVAPDFRGQGYHQLLMRLVADDQDAIVISTIDGIRGYEVRRAWQKITLDPVTIQRLLGTTGENLVAADQFGDFSYAVAPKRYREKFRVPDEAEVKPKSSPRIAELEAVIAKAEAPNPRIAELEGRMLEQDAPTAAIKAEIKALKAVVAEEPIILPQRAMSASDAQFNLKNDIKRQSLREAERAHIRELQESGIDPDSVPVLDMGDGKFEVDGLPVRLEKMDVVAGRDMWVASGKIEDAAGNIVNMAEHTLPGKTIEELQIQIADVLAKAKRQKKGPKTAGRGKDKGAAAKKKKSIFESDKASKAASKLVKEDSVLEDTVDNALREVDELTKRLDNDLKVLYGYEGLDDAANKLKDTAILDADTEIQAIKDVEEFIRAYLTRRKGGMKKSDAADQFRQETTKIFGKAETADFMVELIENSRIDLAKTKAQKRIAAKLGEEEDDVIREILRGSYVRARNARQNFQKKVQIYNWIVENYPDDPVTGLNALLNGGGREFRMKNGVKVQIEGAGASIGAAQAALRDEFNAGFFNDLVEAGVDRAYLSGKFDEELSIALNDVYLGGAQPGSEIKALLKKHNISPEAASIARIQRKYLETMRLRGNRAGADIGFLEGYSVQSHDMFKYRKAFVGQDKARANYINEMMDELDFERILGKANPENAEKVEFLESMFDAVMTGHHMTHGQGVNNGFTGSKNVAKAMSHSRVLHFVDGKAAHRYNIKFGKGNMRESFNNKMDFMANNIALMERMGTNPDDQYAALKTSLMDWLRKSTHLEESAKIRYISELSGQKQDLDWKFAELTGLTKIAGNMSLARAGGILRTQQSLSKLGSAVMSAITDLPVLAYGLHNSGLSYSGAIKEMFTGHMKYLANTKDKRHFASLVGIMSEGMIGHVGERFSLQDGMPGLASKSLAWFFKANLLEWWTDGMRITAALAQSHHMVSQLGTKYGKQNARTLRALRRYNINENMWGLLKKGVGKGKDGRDYLDIPTLMENITDAEAIAYSNSLRAKGAPVGTQLPDDAGRARSLLSTNLRSYFQDMGQLAVIQPNVSVNAYLRMGTQPGTPFGEAIRSFTQFKSFPLAAMRGPLTHALRGTRAIKQRSSSAWTRPIMAPLETMAAMKPGGDVSLGGVTHLIAGMTMFGGMALNAKALARGQTPRWFVNEDEHEDPTSHNTKLLMAWFTQGGGGGIYGDLLFGTHTRYGQGPLTSMLGPGWGTANQIQNMIIKAREGDSIAVDAFRFLQTNAPGANLFWAKPVIDYSVGFGFLNWLNPGSAQGYEDAMWDRNRQEFYVSPATAAEQGPMAAFEEALNK